MAGHEGTVKGTVAGVGHKGTVAGVGHKGTVAGAGHKGTVAGAGHKGTGKGTGAGAGLEETAVCAWGKCCLMVGIVEYELH